MVRLTSEILIGDYKFDYVTEVEINSSWNEFTDTAIIKLPKKR